MLLRDILEKNMADTALIIGNGINRFGNNLGTNSWSGLLGKLARGIKNFPVSQIPDGITLIEYFDLLELQLKKEKKINSLQKQFCELMDSWQPTSQHCRILKWAKKNKCPILTTNFDKTLAKAGKCKLFHINTSGFTDYYPWQSYYGDQQLSKTEDGFGIWHLNGMALYYRSIRLGLSHYMGSVMRARSWMHRGNSKRLFANNGINNWEGAKTWLQLIFRKPLIIFGLGLGSDEVFLRWLLIERARYFQKFPRKRKDAWYIYVSSEKNKEKGKYFFLKQIGVTLVAVDSYEDIYSECTWG